MEAKLIHPNEIIKNILSKDLSGVKVTFINMPIREQAPPVVPPLGPALLSSRLRQYNAIPTIIDLNSYRITDKISKGRGLINGRYLTESEITDLLKNHFNVYGDQHVIAFSGILTTLKWQQKIAKIIRQLQPDAFLVSGNGLATEFEVILFDWIPELDAIATGEGDDIIIKIAYDAQIIKNKGLKSACNSGKLKPYYLGEINGKPRFLYKGDRPLDLNALPLPAWDLLHEDVNGFKIFDLYLRNAVWGKSANNSSAAPFTMEKSMTTVSSRGCPFSCKFCYRGMQSQKNYGIRSAEHLTKEVRWLIDKYKIDFIGFNDDNFMVSKKRIKELAPLLEPLNIKWGTHGRMDEAADMGYEQKRIDLMARSGCVYIGFGAESAHAEVLKNMGKGGFILSHGTTNINGYTFPTTMIEAIKAVKNAGIHGNCTWIMGYPGETLEQLKTSVAFIKWQEEFYTQGLAPGTEEYEIAATSVNKNMFTATAYPGTEMFKHPVVREKLSKLFGIKYNQNTLTPVYNENMKKYVLSLDDATKVLFNNSGKPLNFSAMPDDIFLEAKTYIEGGEIFKILEM